MSGMVKMRGAARAIGRLRRLVAGLALAAGGAALEATIPRVVEQIEAVASSWLGRHSKTGAAAASLSITSSSKSVRITNVGYLHFHRWPFRNGLPPFVINRAIKIYRQEAKRLLST